jgi:carbamoyltransferase
MNILGISAFYHDSAACLLQDGVLTAAAQEERFSRIKHDDGFPAQSIAFCLDYAGLSIDAIDYIIFYDKPLIKFERLLQTYLACAPFGLRSFIMAMPLWLKKKLWIPDIIARETGFKGKILFAEHHESHAASAFFPSPFEEAAIITADGVGEWTTTSYAVGRGNRVRILSRVRFPHSLGLLYSAFTYHTGFKVNSGEYKLMGLAPYGEPRFADLIKKELIDIRGDGSFKMNMKYFNYPAGLTMTNRNFSRLFGGPPRRPESPITQREMDMAASVQVVTEEIMLKTAHHARRETGMKNLCLAGGVALNCVANGKILREGIFDNIWIQPASGDSGGAVGAAYTAWHHYLDKPRTPRARGSQSASYLGPEFSKEKIRISLDTFGAAYEEVPDAEIAVRAADIIASELVMGWFQGRMEFGPRALGARSIIGDARSPHMQSVMNLKIKYRESFRPFAPSVLADRAAEFFDINCESPYMLLVANVRQDKLIAASHGDLSHNGLDKLKVVRSEIPAVTHVDNSARLQTVHREDNQLYYDTIDAFRKKTGCPVIINTSFNVRGEPIVCTPEHAYTCFMRTEMDYLFVGNFLLDKKKQPAFNEDKDWRQEFELD